MKHALGDNQKSQKQWSLESHLGCWIFKDIQVSDCFLWSQVPLQQWVKDLEIIFFFQSFRRPFISLLEPWRFKSTNPTGSQWTAHTRKKHFIVGILDVRETQGTTGQFLEKTILEASVIWILYVHFIDILSNKMFYICKFTFPVRKAFWRSWVILLCVYSSLFEMMGTK